MRVAIVGGPGVGKSTLVRQLADLYHNGAYGEGEKGVWDTRVLEDIATGVNSAGVNSTSRASTTPIIVTRRCTTVLAG